MKFIKNCIGFRKCNKFRYILVISKNIVINLECENSLITKNFPKTLSRTSKSQITHPGNNQKIISKAN